MNLVPDNILTRRGSSGTAHSPITHHFSLSTKANNGTTPAPESTIPESAPTDGCPGSTQGYPPAQTTRPRPTPTPSPTTPRRLCRRRHPPPTSPHPPPTPDPPTTPTRSPAGAATRFSINRPSTLGCRKTTTSPRRNPPLTPSPQTRSNSPSKNRGSMLRPLTR